MSTTTEHTPDETPATAEDDEVALPDYAAAVAACGDPQPARDALTAELDAQTPPVIDPDPDAGQADEDEDETTDETSGAEQ